MSSNHVRLGTIAAVSHATPPVRMRSGGLLTTWRPWLEHRAGRTRTWSPPTPGEQALLLCPSGDPANGINHADSAQTATGLRT